MKQTIVLCILDGWGIGKRDESNPIYVSDLPGIKNIEANFPSGSLKSSGLSVGLPWGEAGNSEVGHLTLGSGRVLYQHYLKISNSIESGEFFEKPELKKAFDRAKTNNSAVHLVGLLTKNQVHAAMEHLLALIEMAKKENAKELYIHLFTDGRDSPPRSAAEFIEKVKEKIKKEGIGKISSLAGRYYGMDRDENWKLTEQTYRMLTDSDAPQKTVEKAVKNTYDKNLSDEYLEPAVIEPHPIKDGDSVIFFNYREDRMRQIARPFLDMNFNAFAAKKFDNLYAVAMTQYYNDLPGIPVVFKKEKVENTLGEVLSKNGKIQMRIAESQKYPHITYFFNGLNEKEFPNEYRILIPSEDPGHPDKNPRMRAEEITNRTVVSVNNNEFDFILINYANPDIIAHTGNYNATVEAVKFVDTQLARLVSAVLNQNGILIITSDHGNAESVLDLKTGEPRTEHESNPVPFYLIGNEFKKNEPTEPGSLSNLGMLSDVAPTILDLMNIPKPEEMTGDSLLGVI